MRNWIGAAARKVTAWRGVGLLLVLVGWMMPEARGQGVWDPTVPRGAQWVALQRDAKPGEPIHVEVLKISGDDTTVRVLVPGFWVSEVEYGGRRFSRLHFPETRLGGVGFPEKTGQLGWYDFPEETRHPPLDPEGYREGMALSVGRTLYPESALEKLPQTAEEMEKLGVDPAGARPGIPALRGMLAVDSEASAREMGLEVESEDRQTLSLSLPLVPAGFEAMDQSQEQPRGYLAPQLVDDAFYREFKGEYHGKVAPFVMQGFTGVAGSALWSHPLVTFLGGNDIRVLRDAVVLLKFPLRGLDLGCDVTWDRWVSKPPYINGSVLRSVLEGTGLRIQPVRTARYLIVTPRQYREALQPLADWKVAKGLNVEFAHVGSAPDDDVTADRAAIREYLEAYARKHRCDGGYVLLVGDVDAVPSGRSNRIEAGPDGANASSDYVYGLIGDALFPTLHVGRLSVSGAEQVQVQVSKILQNEQGWVSGNWPRRVVLAANSENDNGSRGVSAAFPSKYARAVNQIADHDAYLVQPDFTVLHAGASNQQTPRATNQDVINAIHAGAGHVLYRGHGDTTTWVGGWDGSSANGASWTTAEINRLTNVIHPVVYSIACQNGRIHLDSVAEHWMNRPGAGAVAHYGASVNTYTVENHERARAIFRAIFEDRVRRLGPALNRASVRSFAATANQSLWENNTFSYILLGDPEMTLRLSPVAPRFALKPDISVRDNFLEIALRDLDIGVITGALVHVQLGDGGRRNGFTAGDGSVRFPGVNPGQVVRVDIHAEGFEYLSVPVGKGVGSLAGRVWQDTDGNGRLDSGEAGLRGVTVFLDLDLDGLQGRGEPAQTTDAEGLYRFEGLNAGQYLVRVQPAGEPPLEGFTQTHPTGGQFPGAHWVAVEEGTEFGTANFGFRKSGQPSDPPRWIAFIPGAAPGTPVRAETVASGLTGSTIRWVLPGLWVDVVEYGGEKFSRVRFPEVELEGLGFPKGQGDRGWYDFPEETGYPPLPSEAYRKALSISVKRPVYPESALDKIPETAEEMEQLGIDPAGARPGIPMMRGLLAVAPETKDEDLEVTVERESTQLLDLEFPLVPAGYEGLDQSAGEVFGYVSPALIDRAFYRDFKGSYVGDERVVTRVGQAGFTAAATVALPLVEHLPSRQILVAPFVNLNVKFLRGGENFDCPLGWDHWIFKLPFINGAALRESLAAKGLRIEASRSARYLILTPRSYRTDLEELARWKQSKGLNVEFAYVGSAPGDDVPATRAAIDAFLEEYFKKHYCHGVYVLLVGDVSTIPSGRSNRIIAGPDMANGSSDHVYSVLGNDRFSSLYVGRLSVNGSEQLQVQLAKILTQERRMPAGDWPLRVVLAANSENDDGTRGVSASFPSKYARAVNDTANYGSYSVQPDFTVLHAGASSNQATRATNQDVINAIHSGAAHVLYRGHGDTTTWVGGWDGSSVSGTSWTTGRIDALTNSVYPIVYSIACQNARIHLDSISEHWMNRPGGGASAHYGASVNSYTTENHERTKGIFQAIFQDGYRRLGPALSRASTRSHLATGGGDAWDNNTFCYILLGDPEMSIRSSRLIGNLTLVPEWFASQNGIVIDVRDTAKFEVPAALVHVELLNGTRWNGFTGTNGRVQIPNIRLADIRRVDIHSEAFPHFGNAFEPADAPRLVAFLDGTGGMVRLRVIGGQGRYRLESSENLQRWRDEGRVELEAPALDLGDFPVEPGGHRFYRLVGE